MIRPTMSHAVDKQHLHELISVYATNLERKIAELEKELGFTYDKAIKNVKAHDLEQQAKGIKDLQSDCACHHAGGSISSTILSARFKSLLSQSEELKE